VAILTSTQTWRRNPETDHQLGNRLNPIERENVRNALAYLCGRYAALANAAVALGITLDGLNKGLWRRRPQTYRLACIVARTANVPVEKILTGLWPGDRCPHCGGTGKRSQIVRGAK